MNLVLSAFRRRFNLALVILGVFSLTACDSSSVSTSSTSAASAAPAPAVSGVCETFSLARTKLTNGTVCSAGTQGSPLVRLYVTTLLGGNICTGTVISEDTILTAAHCFDGFVTSVNIETTLGSFVSAQFLIPNSFNPDPRIAVDDIALVKTTTPMPIRPMPLLITADPNVGEGGVIGGYGETAGGAFDGNVRAGIVLVSDVSASHVFVRFEGNQAHPCQGDSGGPLLVPRENQAGLEGTVVGVVSQSDPSISIDAICEPGDITLYTKLSKPSVVTFLSRFAPEASVF